MHIIPLDCSMNLPFASAEETPVKRTAPGAQKPRTRVGNSKRTGRMLMHISVISPPLPQLSHVTENTQSHHSSCIQSRNFICNYTPFHIQGQVASGEFYQMFKRKQYQFCTNSSGIQQGKKRFCGGKVILIPDKGIMRNWKRNHLMNVDAKLCYKVGVDKAWQQIKKVIHHDQVGLIPGMQGWFNCDESISIIFFF